MKRDINFILDKVLNRTLGFGGVTTDLQGNQPTSGYMVSIKGCERVISIDLLGKEAILKYINYYRDKIGYGNYLGAWLYQGKVYLDISVNFTSLNEAIKFGRENDQKAIYSLDSDKSINL